MRFAKADRIIRVPSTRCNTIVPSHHGVGILAIEAKSKIESGHETLGRCRPTRGWGEDSWGLSQLELFPKSPFVPLSPQPKSSIKVRFRFPISTGNALVSLQLKKSLMFQRSTGLLVASRKQVVKFQPIEGLNLTAIRPHLAALLCGVPREYDDEKLIYSNCRSSIHYCGSS